MISEETFTCHVCGKKIFRKDSGWVYHKSISNPVHLNHHGVQEWYDDLLKKSEITYDGIKINKKRKEVERLINVER